MPDDNIDIELLIAEFELSIERQRHKDNLRKIGDSLNEQTEKLNKLQKDINDAIAKEKSKAAKNAGCLSGDSNVNCIKNGLKDPFEKAKEKANELADKLKNGKITGEQYIEQMKGLIDELPFSERDQFVMFLQQDILKNKLAGLEDLVSIIPGFEKFGYTFKGVEGLITYLQAFTTGGEAAAFEALKSLLPFAAKEGFEMILQGVIAGIAIGVSPAFPLGALGYFLVSGVISEGISDLMYERDEDYQEQEFE